MSNFNLFYVNYLLSVLQPLLIIQGDNLKLRNFRFIAKIPPGSLRILNFVAFSEYMNFAGNLNLNLNSTHCALQERRRAPLPLSRHGHVYRPLLYCRPCQVHYMGGRAECFHWKIPRGELHQNWTLLPPKLNHLC